jgi:hypothetical protein
MAAVDSSMTTVTPSGVHFGDEETEDDYVRMHGTVAGEDEYAIVLGGGPEGEAAVRVRNVQDAHLLTDAATWGQVVTATDNAVAGAARQATYKAPCATSSQGVLAVLAAEEGTLTIARDTEGFDGDTWYFGGRALSALDASEGARVLIRHGVSITEGATDHAYNGIYYFAAGHGLESEDGPLTITRATDMNTNVSVRGATTYVSAGTDAGKVFVVTEPEDYADDFELGMGDIEWTVHAGQVQLAVNAVAEKRPCVTSTSAPLNVQDITATTITLALADIEAGEGLWELGGKTLTATDVLYGARILVRHGVIYEMSTYTHCNGIYYFAEGHGLGPEAVSFTLTRVPDMATDADVPAACVRVLFGDDAGRSFMVTRPPHTGDFELGTDDIEWSAAADGGNVVAGAGVAVAGGNTVSLDVETLEAMDVADLDDESILPIAASTGGTFKCTLQTLAELEQDLSNKTLSNSAFSGNVGFDEAAVLQVNSNDLLTLRTGSLTVAGTLSATVIMAKTVAGPSDINLKDAVEKCPGLDAVRRLEGSKWQWKSDGSPGMGLIAQWLMRVEPSLVVEGPEGLGILYNGLVGVLVNAVNDLDAQLQAVVTRVQALEQRPSVDLTL